MAEVVDCMERSWAVVPFWLNESEAGKADDRSFSTEYDKRMMNWYIEYWQQFIYYCLKTMNEKKKLYEIQLINEQ